MSGLAIPKQLSDFKDTIDACRFFPKCGAKLDII